ncbi:MAG TPA: C-type lectin domain-containing protein [Kofleriaceae bacterium]
MRALAAVPLLLAGCVQVFELEDPVTAEDNEPPEGSGSGSSNPTTPPACAGTIVGATCYERGTMKATWTTARDSCAANGGMLAKMDSNPVATALALLVSLGEEVWLGASVELPGAPYRWVDGSEVTLFAWLPSQPDGSGFDHCIALYNAGAIGWDDLFCNEELAFICQRTLQ